MGASLGVWRFIPSHFPSLSGFLLACKLANPCLGYEPKARVTTPKLGLLWFWRAITSCANLRLKWDLKQNFSPCRDFSNSMLHVTYTQVNQGDSWFVVVESQIGNLIRGFSFGHNLCFKYPNGSCEPILNIYIPKAFQRYKKLSKPMITSLTCVFITSKKKLEFLLKDFVKISLPM